MIESKEDSSQYTVKLTVVKFWIIIHGYSIKVRDELDTMIRRDLMISTCDVPPPIGQDVCDMDSL